MFTVASLWVPFTVTAAFGQVARNAMQRSLTSPLGTWGATNIRRRQRSHAGAGRGAVRAGGVILFYSFKQPLSLHEFGGIVLIVIGVGLLVAV
jgi:hypothetical protein